MHLHREAPLDYRLQIRTPPPNHPIALRIGPLNDQRLQLRLLCVRQPWRTARAATRLQAVDPLVVVAMHPVPQGLSVHSGPLRRLASRVAVQCQGDRQQPANLGRVVALAGRGPQIRRAVIRPRNRQCLTHPMNPSRESTLGTIESELLESGNPPRVGFNADWYYVDGLRSAP